MADYRRYAVVSVAYSHRTGGMKTKGHGEFDSLDDARVRARAIADIDPALVYDKDAQDGMGAIVATYKPRK